MASETQEDRFSRGLELLEGVLRALSPASACSSPALQLCLGF